MIRFCCIIFGSSQFRRSRDRNKEYFKSFIKRIINTAVLLRNWQLQKIQRQFWKALIKSVGVIRSTNKLSKKGTFCMICFHFPMTQNKTWRVVQCLKIQKGRFGYLFSYKVAHLEVLTYIALCTKCSAVECSYIFNQRCHVCIRF